MSTGLKRGIWAALLLICLVVGAYALRGAFAFGEPPITAATPSPAAAAAAAATSPPSARTRARLHRMARTLPTYGPGPSRFTRVSAVAGDPPRRQAGRGSMGDL